MTILAIAGLWDARKGRIPNGLVLIGIAIGGIQAILNGGANGLFRCILCMGLAGSVFYFFFYAGLLGAGDVKLFAMIFAWTGLAEGLRVMFLTFLTALFLALSAVVQGLIKKRGIAQILRTPVKLAPAAFVGWAAYLGGVKIG